MAVARGFRRNPYVQNNNAPMGYGQVSPYLNQPQPPAEEQQQEQPQVPVYRGAVAMPQQQANARRESLVQARTQPVGRGVPVSAEPEKQLPPHLMALDELEREGNWTRSITGGDTRSALLEALAGVQARKAPGGADSGANADSAVTRGSQQQSLPGGYTMSGSSQYGIDGAPPDWANRKLTMDDILAGVEDGYVDGPEGDMVSNAGTATNTPSNQASRAVGARSGMEMVGSWGDTSGLRGFNTAEWGQNSPEYDEASMKNNFGKIATRYQHNPDGVRALVQDEEFKYFFPKATLVDHPTDPKIDFGDGTEPVDVLFQTDKGWQWLPEFQGGAPAAGGFAGDALGAPGAMPQSDFGNDPQLAAIASQLGLDGNSIRELLEQMMLEEEQQQALISETNSYLP